MATPSRGGAPRAAPLKPAEGQVNQRRRWADRKPPRRRSKAGRATRVLRHPPLLPKYGLPPLIGSGNLTHLGGSYGALGCVSLLGRLQPQGKQTPPLNAPGTTR